MRAKRKERKGKRRSRPTTSGKKYVSSSDRQAKPANCAARKVAVAKILQLSSLLFFCFTRPGRASAINCMNTSSSSSFLPSLVWKLFMPRNTILSSSVIVFQLRGTSLEASEKKPSLKLTKYFLTFE